MKTPILIGVWKNRLNYTQSLSAARELSTLFDPAKYPFICGVAPTPVAMVSVKEIIDQKSLVTCSQNVMWAEEKGTFIGETTIPMLKDLNVGYVIVGHSERRTTFSEDDSVVLKKSISCISSGITPIVCVGDTAEERAKGETWDVIDRQVRALLESAEISNPDELILAYEPMWAISTWRTDEPLPTGEIIGKIQADIRKLVESIRGPDFAKEISILYGGSVNPENGREYMLQPDVDGALIGGASLVPSSLVGTFDACLEGYNDRENSQVGR